MRDTGEVLAVGLELQLPDVDVVGILLELISARFDKCVLAIGKDAFDLVVLSRKLPIYRRLSGIQIDAEDVGKWRAIAGVDQLAVLLPEVLRLERAFRRLRADDFLFVRQLRAAALIDDVGGVDRRFPLLESIRVLAARVRPRDFHRAS